MQKRSEDSETAEDLSILHLNLVLREVKPSELPNGTLKIKQKKHRHIRTLNILQYLFRILLRWSITIFTE